MEGLFYAIEREEYTKIHLLRFYENSEYVIAKTVTGNDQNYIKKELKNFRMEGFDVIGEPEYTFCGAFMDSGSSISFKVENQLADSSESWVYKDVLTFKGSILDENTLLLKQISKRTSFEVERTYKRASEEEILSEI